MKFTETETRLPASNDLIARQAYDQRKDVNQPLFVYLGRSQSPADAPRMFGGTALYLGVGMALLY